MNRIDLIIDALQKAKDGWQCFDEYEKALVAARELKSLKPVGYMDSRGVLFNKTTHPQLNTPLYAFEVTK
jgi:hypothetical protein